MNILPMGDSALLVELADLAEVWSLSKALAADPALGQVDLVPAARTVLIRLSDGADLAAATRHVEQLTFGPVPDQPSAEVSIDVVYDGADLAEVADLTGLGVDGVIAAHTSSNWKVAFSGFAPGFGYLVGGDPRLQVPRRPTPRPSVPAGSVGLAGEFSGVYPRSSPGGWRLIGRTDADLWNPDRDSPALLAPGTRVRFRQVDHLAPRASKAVPASPVPHGVQPDLRVTATGPLCTFQDLGRPGFGALGVPTSGAADRLSAQQANRLVGNPDTAVVLEVTLGRARLLATRDLLVSVTGADVALTLVTPAPAPAPAPAPTPSPELTVPAIGQPNPTPSPESAEPAFGQPNPTGAELTTPSAETKSEAAFGRAFTIPAGTELRLGGPPTGLRNYLAVAGGFDVPLVLGSASSDTLSELGPAPIRAGDGLWVARGKPIAEMGPTAQADSKAMVYEHIAVAEHSPRASAARPDSGLPRSGAGISVPEPYSDPLAPQPGAHAALQPGADPLALQPGAHAALQPGARPGAPSPVMLRITRGPRAGHLTPTGLDALTSQTFTVSANSNRVALRLSGPESSVRATGEELASEGLVPGAIQVPPDGWPVVFLADHPVTGGYPVVGVLATPDVAVAAQLRPGARVTFAFLQ